MALVHPWSSWAREPARRDLRGTPLFSRGSSGVRAREGRGGVWVASGGGRERVPLWVSGSLRVALLPVLQAGSVVVALW